MKILVVGGTGNISTEVVAELLGRGHDVTLVTRGTKPVPTDCGHIIADVSDKAAYSAAVRDWRGDVVINFLAYVPRDCQADHDIFRGRIAQYVFISSATVYRKPHETLPLTENSPRGNDYSEYARNKIACEDYLSVVAGGVFPTTVVRPSHTFGQTWIPSPLSSADWTVSARILAGKPIVVHGDGQSLWTLTAASDFAAGLAGLLGRTDTLDEAFHITSDQPLTWNCIYQELGRALGVEPQIVHVPTRTLVEHYPQAEAKLLGDKAEHGVFDNAKIKRFVPDFTCRKTFRDAISESVAWFRADPARCRVNPERDALLDAWAALGT